MKLTSWLCKLTAGVGFASYAIFSVSIGAMYLPRLRSASLSFTPIWSTERPWAPFTGVPEAVLAVALLLIAMSQFVRPAAGTAYWEQERSSRRESWGRVLLRAGGGLYVLGLFLSIGIWAPDPSPATVESIRAVIRAERTRDEVFRNVQPLWGVTLFVSVIATMVDMILRYRSERAPSGIRSGEHEVA